RLRIRGSRIGIAEEFQIGLQELPALTRTVAEDRAKAGIAGGAAGGAARQVVAADWDRELRTQAQFTPVRPGGDEQATPDVLADEIEKHVCRLQDRRIDPLAAAREKPRQHRLAGHGAYSASAPAGAVLGEGPPAWAASILLTACTRSPAFTVTCAGRLSRHSRLSAIVSESRFPRARSLICT